MTKEKPHPELGIRTHTTDQCGGPACPIHAPSDHKMKDWEMRLRFDRGCLIERLCPEHGVGHPDPDSAAYLKSVDPRGNYTIHGCCGCCMEELK